MTDTEARRFITPEQRESKIQRLIWTSELEGIEVSRETAEQAIEASLRRPLPRFSKEREL